MSALIFIGNAIAIVILVLTSLRNDKRKPGEPMIGIFEYKEKLERKRAKVRQTPDYLKRVI
jgi:hypothetical protein